jgi:hypothetical protein
MIEEKVLSVALQIKKIDLNKRELTLCLKDDPLFEDYNKEALELLTLLMQQHVNYFSDIPIRGLELRYKKYSGENLK